MISQYRQALDLQIVLEDQIVSEEKVVDGGRAVEFIGEHLWVWPQPGKS